MPDTTVVDIPTEAVTDESASSLNDLEPDVSAAADSDASATSSTAPETTETVTDSDDGSEPAGEPKVIRELKAQRRKKQEAEREAQYWRDVAEGRIPRPAPQSQGELPQGAPIVTDFDSYEDYLVAKAKYELKKEQERVTVTDRLRRTHDAFIQKLSAEVEQNPDSEIMEIATDLGERVNATVGWIIKDSDVPVGLIRYLNDHPAIVTKLNGLSPTAAAREIGRIEAIILNPPRLDTKKVSSAPAPVTTVKPTGPVEFDEEKCSMDEYHARRNKERSANQRR